MLLLLCLSLSFFKNGETTTMATSLSVQAGDESIPSHFDDAQTDRQEGIEELRKEGGSSRREEMRRATTLSLLVLSTDVLLASCCCLEQPPPPPCATTSHHLSFCV